MSQHASDKALMYVVSPVPQEMQQQRRHQAITTPATPQLQQHPHGRLQESQLLKTVLMKPSCCLGRGFTAR
jgi:hypothetical protein